MAKLKDAGRSIDLGRTGLPQDEFMLHFFFLRVLSHNMTWANLRERTLVTKWRKVFNDSADVLRTGRSEDVTAFTAERAAFQDKERLPKCSFKNK